ncbi:uncharacterized protein BJ171DRAFT_424473, partial [Polychytrium aggregatum]|uniref:uncharacterized protein n=1 Tax=Polychytrium aggregatum TaxID=110093 RepID=UPI0022FF42F4
YQCDVSTFDAVSRVAATIASEVGSPTMVINCVGIVNGKTLIDLTPEEVQRSINCNLAGHFWIAKCFLPEMLARNRGHLITISSTLGMKGVSQLTDYTATKFGLIGMHESLRQELSKTNVRTSCIYPGLVNTALFSGVQYRLSQLFPVLESQDVARTIVSVLESNRSQDVVLPFIFNFMPLMRAFPIEITDLATTLLGANENMKQHRKQR